MQSDTSVGPGSRATLTVEVELPKDVHVYAPGVQGYKPIALQLDPTPEAKFGPVQYPKPEILFLQPIHEKVPVFSGKFRITQDVTLSFDPQYIRSLRFYRNGAGKRVTLTGTLSYQACDETTCFLPEKVGVSWNFTALPLDGKRASKSVRHSRDP
jgi:hypothetical protein